MKTHRGILTAAIVAAIVILILIIGTLARARQQATPPSPTVTSNGAPTFREAPSPAGTAVPAKALAEAAASSFIQAYSSQSWRDPDATAWISRAALHATPEFARQLAELHAGSGGTDWDRFVKDRFFRAVQVDYVDAQLTDPQSGIVAVRYHVTTMAEGAEPATLPQSKLLRIKRDRDGEWRVSAINELSAGFAPATREAPTAPAQAPTISE